jgi:hypothetical protein
MNCKRLARQVYRRKGRLLCFFCNRRSSTIIPPPVNRNVKYTLQKALDKTYIVKGYVNSKGSLQAQISMPSILVGHKIKLVLVDKQ